MKTSFIVATIGLIFLLFATTTRAEEPLSLSMLIQEARANNFEIKAMEERVRAMEARARTEGALDDPTLKIELKDIDTGRPTPGSAMLTQYTVSQMFPFPGKLSLKEKMALKEVLAERGRFSAKELEIAASVKEAYYDYALATEAIGITGEIKELLADTARLVEVKYSTGSASQQDAIKILVETTMLANDVISLEAQRDVAAARLKGALNRPQDSSLGEPAKLPRENVSFIIEELMDAAVGQNPEIKVMEAEVEAGDLGVKLAQKNYYPDFMIGAAPIQRDNRFESFDVMFQMSIPIWRGKYNGLSKAASSSAASARNTLAAQKNAVRYEVKAAALEVEASGRMKALLETGLIPQAELALESALKSYQSGKADFLSLLDAARMLKNARLEYIKTLAEYRKRLASLERIVGKDVISPEGVKYGAL